MYCRSYHKLSCISNPFIVLVLNNYQSLYKSVYSLELIIYIGIV